MAESNTQILARLSVEVLSLLIANKVITAAEARTALGLTGAPPTS